MFQLHIVHIRENVSDVTEAKKTQDGLAVLAFFIKVGSGIFNCPSPISASSLAGGLFVSIFKFYSITVAQDFNLPIFCRHSASTEFLYPFLHPACCYFFLFYSPLIKSNL